MKIGFIGAGNLGGSVLKGLFNVNYLSSKDTFVSEPNANLAKLLKDKYLLNIANNNVDLVQNTDVIFIAVKPYFMNDVLNEIKNNLKTNHIIISLAAGYTLEMMENICPENKFVRVLTNTPAALNAATTTVCKGKNSSEEDLKLVVNIFSLIGSISVIDEKFMDLSTALAGSGPAFFYAVAKAFASGCEKIGLKKEESILMSAQTMLGAAKMLLDSGKDPETLIREVTTPNGCTYEGLKYMKENFVEDILSQTMVVTTQKAATLAQK